jgi:hypothetical protein
MATLSVSVQAAFESRMLARAEVKRHLGPLFSSVMKVVPMCSGYVIHAPGQHSRGRRSNGCKSPQWIWIVDLNPDMWGNGDVIFTACAQVVLVDEASMEMATTIADVLRAMGTTSIMDGAQHAQRKARCWCGRFVSGGNDDRCKNEM